MADSTRVAQMITLGQSPQAEQRYHALLTMAHETGCLHDFDKPGIGTWLQRLADLRLRAEQTGEPLNLYAFVAGPPHKPDTPPAAGDPRHQITVHIGYGPEAVQRRAALLRLAADTGCRYGDSPSVSYLVRYLADLRTAPPQTYYASLRCTAAGQPQSLTFHPASPAASHSPTYWRPVSRSEGRRELYIGVFSIARARLLLQAYAVQIPDQVSVFCGVEYRLGGSTEAEAHNARRAYAPLAQLAPPEDPGPPAASAAGLNWSALEPGKEIVVRNRYTELLAAKELRDNRRWTQADVSRTTGITTATLRNWAAQKVTIYNRRLLDVLCTFLECEVGELLYLAEVDP